MLRFFLSTLTGAGGIFCRIGVEPIYLREVFPEKRGGEGEMGFFEAWFADSTSFTREELTRALALVGSSKEELCRKAEQLAALEAARAEAARKTAEAGAAQANSTYQADLEAARAEYARSFEKINSQRTSADVASKESDLYGRIAAKVDH